MSRRNGRIALKRRPWILLPRNTIGPSDEISRSSASPSVVLPEPDSPTTPSVSPLRTARLTPSTALIWPTVVRKQPALDRKPDLQIVGRNHHRRLRARRRRIGLRLGREQVARIGMLRRGKNLLDRPLLDDLAAVHDADDIGDAPDDAEIVGDEQQAHAEPRADLGQQRQDLRLHGDVERRGRLVRDQKIRLVGERHRDHHALALAAGQLMRIALQPGFRLGNADLRQQFERPRPRLRPADAVVQG